MTLKEVKKFIKEEAYRPTADDMRFVSAVKMAIKFFPKMRVGMASDETKAHKLLVNTTGYKRDALWELVHAFSKILNS